MTTTKIPNGGAEVTTEVSSDADNKRAGSSTGRGSPVMSRTQIIIFGSIACVIILGVAIGTGIYFGTRPENIEVTTSTATETLPTTVNAARISGSPNGFVTIDYTNLLSDPSVLSYYLSIENFIFTEFALAGASLENLAAYLTRSNQPTVEDLGSDPIFIPNILVDQELPYPLRDGFLPGDYNGVLFAVRDSSIDALSNPELFTSSAFDLIVNPDQNIATPTRPLPSVSPSSVVPSVSSSLVPSGSPSLEPTKTCTSSPSGAPTMAPTSPPSEGVTIAPTLLPRNPQQLLLLPPRVEHQQLHLQLQPLLQVARLPDQLPFHQLHLEPALIQIPHPKCHRFFRRPLATVQAAVLGAFPPIIRSKDSHPETFSV
jgi:hypothetical protein